jgi:peptide/nickel transport system permease protein
VQILPRKSKGQLSVAGAGAAATLDSVDHIRRRREFFTSVSYVGRRLVGAILVIYAVITVSFFMVRLMPGSAADIIRGELIQQGISPEAADAQVSAILGIDQSDSLLAQYFDYLVNTSQGDFGTSIVYTGRSVSSILLEALPWTVLLVGSGLLISFAIGTSLGLTAAYTRRSRKAGALTVVSAVMNTIPNYVIGLVLLYFLATTHQIFPASGTYNPNLTPQLSLEFIGSVLWHLVLPLTAFVLGAGGFGHWMLTMKASTTGVLGDDYISASVARGLRHRRIATAYVGRNALLPVVTYLALSVGYLFGGAVFIENIFGYQGLGYFLVSSVRQRDYPLMMGCFNLIIIAVVLANVVVDLLYVRLDPRIKVK